MGSCHTTAWLIAIAIAGSGCAANTSSTAAAPSQAVVAAWPTPPCPADFPTVEQTLAWRAQVHTARATKDRAQRQEAFIALIREALAGSGLAVNAAGTNSMSEIVTADYVPTPALNFDINLNQKTSFRFTPETNVRSLESNGGYYFTKDRVPYIVLGPKIVDSRGPGFIREYAEHEMYHASHHVGDQRPIAERELEAWTYQFTGWFHRKYPYRMEWGPLLDYYSDSGPAAQQIALDKFLSYYANPPVPPVASQCVEEVRSEFKKWVEQRLADPGTGAKKMVRDLAGKLDISIAAATAPNYWLYWVGAGDLNADGKDEVLRWDNHRKQLVVYDQSAGTPREIAAQAYEDAPVMTVIADIDGDHRKELIVGEGLDNYNPPTGPQRDVVIRIYKPLEPNGWTPVELFRAQSERPTVTSLHVVNVDADPEPEIMFSYFASKYQVDYAIADFQQGAWKIEKLPTIRMGTQADFGNVLDDGRTLMVVGRPYADPTAEDLAKKRTPLGEAFIMIDGKRVMLPVHRGVSSLAIGDVDYDRKPDIVVSDGWHSDYGKVARGRLSILHHTGGKWSYETIEDVPSEMRLNTIEIVDVNGDGKNEIVVQGEERTPFKQAQVRLYQSTPTGWRKAILVDSAKAFAVGDFNGDGEKEIVVSGTDLTTHPIDFTQIVWQTKMFPPVETFLNDPKALIGQPATELIADEWVNGGPVTLASLRGKVVLLDYWATWCAPCIAAFPGLKRLKGQYGPQGFAIVGVTNHSEQTSADVRKMVAKKALTWPTAIDPGSRTHMNFGVQNLPHQIMIDRNGVIRSFYVGGGESINAIEADIKKLLAEPATKGN